MTEGKKLIEDFLHQGQIFKLYSRNSSVQIAENFAYFCMLKLNKFRHLRFKQLMIGRNEFMDVYCLQEEFVKMEKFIEIKLKKSKNIKDFFEKDGLPVFYRYADITNKIGKKYSGIKDVGNLELLRDYKTFAKINAEFIAFNFFVYLSDPVIDRILRTPLSNYLEKIKQKDKEQDYLVCISTPLKKPAVVEEHLALLKLIYKNKTNNKKLLELHKNQWGWFPCYNPSDEPYKLEHYTKEMNRYTADSAKQEIDVVLREQKRHTIKFKHLLNKIKNKDLKKLIKIINSISYYREYRNDIRRRGLRDISPLYKMIGKKFGLDTKEVCYLTNSEIQKILKNGSCPITKSQIRGRFKNYLIFTDLNHNIFIDNKNKIQEITKRIKIEESNSENVKGITAVEGSVQGKVRIISSIKVLSEFKNGEILVASMTAPEYVPAMKKALAIVTDEGGITCHAAVISRELGVPCIVGTKLATKIFRDGDRVEVNTTTGIVRKI